MEPAAQAKRLHDLAWQTPGDSFSKLLEEALTELRPHIDQDELDDDLIANYAAILLDLQKNHAALAFLLDHPSRTREYCANLAIAYAKTNAYANHEKICYWNQQASISPFSEQRRIAFMDWQGL